ncbi:MAG TPA: hypothetical protein H9902_13530, partial [Candidatus Stackebrandtia faecavium]|nr:hypothetical protein [Candidatus Stackebrandtia faecavium]
MPGDTSGSSDCGSMDVDSLWILMSADGVGGGANQCTTNLTWENLPDFDYSKTEKQTTAWMNATNALGSHVTSFAAGIEALKKSHNSDAAEVYWKRASEHKDAVEAARKKASSNLTALMAMQESAAVAYYTVAAAKIQWDEKRKEAQDQYDKDKADYDDKNVLEKLVSDEPDKPDLNGIRKEFDELARQGVQDASDKIYEATSQNNIDGESPTSLVFDNNYKPLDDPGPAPGPGGTNPGSAGPPAL